MSAQAKKNGMGGSTSSDGPLVFDLDLVKNLATTIPIIHVLAACFFLFGYCLAFGKHIIAFVTISDVFAVSIRAIGQVYLFISIPIFAFFILRSRRRRQRNSLAAYNLLLLIVLLLLGAALIPQPFFERARDLQEHVSLGVLIAILAGFFFGLRFADRKTGLKTEYVPGIVAIGLAVFLAFSLALGVNKGLIDGGRRYEAAVQNYAKCAEADKVIIRPIGSYFLALDSAELWSLVDEECKTRFSL